MQPLDAPLHQHLRRHFSRQQLNRAACRSGMLSNSAWQNYRCERPAKVSWNNCRLSGAANWTTGQTAQLCLTAPSLSGRLSGLLMGPSGRSDCRQVSGTRLIMIIDIKGRRACSPRRRQAARGSINRLCGSPLSILAVSAAVSLARLPKPMPLPADWPKFEFAERAERSEYDNALVSRAQTKQ